MSLSYQQLNYNTYVDERDDFIKLHENGDLARGDMSKLDAHVTVNTIAMGYGYDLFQNTDTLKRDLSSLVTAKKANITVDTALDTVKNLILNHRIAIYKTLENGTKKFERWEFKPSVDYPTIDKLQEAINAEITLANANNNDDNAVAWMELKVNAVEQLLSTSLGADDLALSKERIALVDITYNMGSTGSNLLGAIKTDTRVEAWFEIRYGSNFGRVPGLDNRRKDEAELFGLYSSGASKPNSDNEAKQVIRFLKTKEDFILNSYIANVKGLTANDYFDNLQPAK